ncbi:MAG: hypothetical protein ACFCVF_13240 [Kineosporiaceae bacterium]
MNRGTIDTAREGGEAAAALGATLRRSVVVLVVAGVAAGVALAAVAAAVDGPAGLAGALIGIGLAVAFLAVTSLVGSVTARRDPLVMAAALMGSWLVKAVSAIAVLLVVRDAGLGEPLWVGVGILVGVILSLAVQVRLLVTARVPYVDPSSRAAPPDRDLGDR